MFWAHGMVFWPWVWFRYDRPSHRLFRHELEHVYQVQKYGRLGFLLRYVWKWITCGFSYKRHPMEQEARAVENQPLTPTERGWYDKGVIRL